VSVATTVLASATAVATSSPQDGSGGGGLSGGAKAGIGIGVAVIVLAIIGAAAFFVLKRRRGRNEKAPPYQRGVEMPAAGEKQYDGKPVEMSAQGQAVELPTRMSAAELPTEKERIARVDDRVAAGYEGAYRGN
jgi:hypothetical protein